MKEISRLVSDFDSRIVLSADCLYERFGRENGAEILAPYFSDVKWLSYEDSLLVPDAEPLILYILSCHGNQNQYLLDRYSDFKTFIQKKLRSFCAAHIRPISRLIIFISILVLFLSRRFR